MQQTDEKVLFGQRSIVQRWTNHGKTKTEIPKNGESMIESTIRKLIDDFKIKTKEVPRFLFTTDTFYFLIIRDFRLFNYATYSEGELFILGLQIVKNNNIMQDFLVANYNTQLKDIFK